MKIDVSVRYKCTSNFNNLPVNQKPARWRVDWNGRGCAKLVEPMGLSVSRIYEIPWKKQSLYIAELARMRSEEKLGSRVIAQRLGLPRSTVIDAIHHLERKG